MWGHVRGKGEDREVVGSDHTKEDVVYVCFDGVGEGSVRVGETDMEQLVVEGVGPAGRGRDGH